MSLLKVPVIVILTIGFKAMLTPPHPPPAKDEVIESTKFDVRGIRRVRFTIAHVRTFSIRISSTIYANFSSLQTAQVLVAAAEIVAIFAVNYPSSPVSQKILSFCVFEGGKPDSFRLTPLSTLGAVLWAAGAMLRVRTYKDLGRFFRYEISIQKDHRLVTTGPYAYVRHPAYTGMLLANIGWFLWNGAEGSWVRESGFLNSTSRKILLAFHAVFAILATSGVTLSRMSKEDRALREKFGKKWDEWAARVPYSVIPGIY